MIPAESFLKSSAVTDKILDELHRVVELLKGDRLTIEKFNKLARVHSTTLRYRFGSWTAALDRAGISDEIAPRQRIVTKKKGTRTINGKIVHVPFAQ